MTAPSFNRRLQMAALVRAIGLVPPGERLNIRALRDPLGLSQAEAIGLIEALIGEGRLDPETVRPVARQERDLTRRRGAAEDGPSGAQLAAELDALIAEHGLSKKRVGLFVYGCGYGVEMLRRTARPKAGTVAKVRTLLSAPIDDKLRSRRRPSGHSLSEKISAGLARKRDGCASEGGGPSPGSPMASPTSPRRGDVKERRDPTSPPVDPLLELAEKQRLNGQRFRSSVLRGQEAEAAARLDAGEAGRNNFEQKLINDIARRREAEARQQDPVEVAKTALRRRGWNVFDASVHGGRRGRYMVHGKRDPDTGKPLQFTGDELIALAKRVNPRAMEVAAA